VERDYKSNRRYHRESYKRQPKDEKVIQLVNHAEEYLVSSFKPFEISDLNGFQRKQIYHHFEKKQEYKVKSYRKDKGVVLKIFPIGNIKRLAEQKAQEVLIKGEPEVLSPMGSFERFIIHNYLKDREGIKTESYDEGLKRHVEIHPVFGRNPKKTKRKLTR